MKRFVIGIAAVSVFFSVASAADEPELVVGMSATLTGPSGRAGEEQLHGLQLWLEESNARGGLLGRKLKLVYYDDGANPEAGAQRYQKLIVEDKAALLVGPFAPETTLAAAAVADKLGVPLIATGVLSRELWNRGYKNVFGLYTPPDRYLDSVLAFAKRRGLRRIALVYQNSVGQNSGGQQSSVARELADGVKAGAAALGLRVVLEEGYGADFSDFSPILKRLGFKRPDVIFAGSTLQDSLAFVRQAKEHKVSAKIMVLAFGANSPEFAKLLGADADGLVGTSPWESTLKLPGAAEFARRYKTRFGRDAGFQAAGGYAAGQVLETAVRKADSVEGEKLSRTLFELDTMTVFGRYKVDKTGRQVGKAGYVVQWLHGERVPVLPEEFAGAAIAYPLRSWGKR